jgi:hypothetical protein
MSLFSQLPAGIGGIGMCYPAAQLMHRVSDPFVQQPRLIAAVSRGPSGDYSPTSIERRGHALQAERRSDGFPEARW